jgi:hypothetical protein
MRQAYVSREPNTVIVRTPVHHPIGHVDKDMFVDRQTIAIVPTGYGAHV